MSNNNLAREKFEEGMTDFVGHNYGRSIDLLSPAIDLDPCLFHAGFKKSRCGLS